MKKGVLAICDIMACLILALAFSAAPYYISDGYCNISLGYIFTAAAMCGIFLTITFFIRKYLQSGEWHTSVKPLWAAEYFDKLENLITSKNAAFKIALIILAFWIIPLVFLYPGTFINDTWAQIQQFIRFFNGDVTALNDHNPILDSYIMWLFIVPASQMTGHWHRVIFFYVMIQAMLTAIAFSYTVVYAYKKLGLGIRATAGMLLVYCLLPIFPSAVQTVSKDALHSWGFVFFILFYLEMVRTGASALKDKGFLVKLLIIVMYCCLTKKVAYYVILLSLVTFLVFQKNYRKYVLIPILFSCILMNVAMPALINNLQIKPGGKQEMLSIPFQMTARYVKYHSDDITEEEYKVIDKVLIMDTLAERYLPTNADPVKGYSPRGDDEDYSRYLKVWFKQGLRHPGTYITAFNCMASGWFSWYDCTPLMNNDWRNAQDTELIPDWVALRGFSEVTARGYEEMLRNMHKLPVIQVFLSYGFYCSLVPAFLVCTVLRKWEKKKLMYWLSVLPIVFSVMLGCWLAPVSIHFEGKRYLYPIIYSIPLMVVWCMYIYKENQD